MSVAHILRFSIIALGLLKFVFISRTLFQWFEDHGMSRWVGGEIWKLDVLLKIQIFLRQLFHKALPSWGTLMRRGLQIEPICPACLAQIEDTEHFCALCPFTVRVWDLAALHGWIPRPPFAMLHHTICDALHEWYSQCRTTTPKIAVCYSGVYGKVVMLSFFKMLCHNQWAISFD